MRGQNTMFDDQKLIELKAYRRSAITAAEELGYSYETLAKLDKAKTEEEISRIMTNARKERFG